MVMEKEVESQSQVSEETETTEAPIETEEVEEPKTERDLLDLDIGIDVPEEIFPPDWPFGKGELIQGA